MKHLEGINKLILLAPLLYIIAFFAYPLTYMMLSRADPVRSVFYALTGPYDGADELIRKYKENFVKKKRFIFF